MKKYNFIFISTADWDNPFWTNKQHMAKILSEQGHKVVYFESLGLREPNNFSQKDRKRIIKRIFKFTKGPIRINNNLHVFSPIIFPRHSSSLISGFNNLLMKLYIKVMTIKYLDSEPIYWTYNPLSGDFLKNTIVYHCVDDLSAAPSLPVEKIRVKEKELVKKALVTFVTSKTLKEKMSQYDKKVFYLPNVADVKHFSTALGEQSQPNDLKNIQGPILGFIGAISSYKVDFSLIVKVANTLPMANIVLIGEVGEGQPETKIDLLKNVKNIHILGPKDYKDLPQYLKFIDVALLPCVLNEYTKSMFPMKFFEYLAAEKKVVSTQLESLQEFSDCCYLADSHEDFIRGISKALTSRIEDFCNINHLRLAVSENTWERRTDKMLQILDETFGQC